MSMSIVKQQAGVIAAPVWTKEQRDLIRKTICPPNTTDLEFEFFVTWCAQTGLNPMLKQAWLVPRKQKNPATGRYEEKMEPQVAEVGMRARAEELPDYRGTQGDAVYEGDEFMIDAGAGVVVHKYSTQARAKAGNKLQGAWARVERVGRKPNVVFLTVESRIQTYYDNGKQVPTQFWAKDAPGQIAKCARAHALRLAYPDVFSGVFIAEEMREEIEVNAPPAAPQASASATEELEQRLRAKLSVPKVDAVPLSTEQKVTERDMPNAAAAAAKASPPEQQKKSSVPPITHLRFGPAKGTALADASTIEIEEALEVARKNVASLKEGEQPKWLAGTLEGIAAAEAEIARRDAPEPAPEPGSEG